VITEIFGKGFPDFNFPITMNWYDGKKQTCKVSDFYHNSFTTFAQNLFFDHSKKISHSNEKSHSFFLIK